MISAFFLLWFVCVPHVGLCGGALRLTVCACGWLLD